MKKRTNFLKKVAIIGTAGIPARYGGFETLAGQIIRILHERYKFTVYCNHFIYTKSERTEKIWDVRRVFVSLKSNGLQSVFYDFFSMIHALNKSDILLVLGTSGGLFIPLIRLFTDKKIIVHIDGLEWTRNKWKWPARIFLKLSEMAAVNMAHGVICDHELIEKYVMNKYSRNTVYIPYGGDTKNLPFGREENLSFPVFEYYLSVCRIVPENNIAMILKAFGDMPGRRLIFIGNWKHSRYGRNLQKLYGNFKNIQMINPVYDQNLLYNLRSKCRAYIHGHSAGGTNPSLIESMYAGSPVLAYDSEFNRITTQNAAYYFNSSVSIKNHIVLLTDADLTLVGNRMKQIATEEYTWEKITRKYDELFRGFLI